MAHIDISRLTQNATVLGSRALQVQQDPAVQKAWALAASDFVTAAKSGANLVSEGRAAWRRSGTGGARVFMPRLA